MGLDRRSRAYADMLYRGLRTAADRMAAQCAALGGDGVVGVQLQASRYRGDKRTRQFTAAGTAVRAAWDVRTGSPFLACPPRTSPDCSLRAGCPPTS